MSKYNCTYIIAFGDLHGYFTKFGKLWNKIRIYPEFYDCELVFLGDYVDGGYETAELITELQYIEGDYPTTFLLGNHEQMMLDAKADPNNAAVFNLWWYQGGSQTALSYQVQHSSLLHEHLRWLKALPLVYETENHIFVHAGLRPNTSSVDETPDKEKLWIREEFLDSNYNWWNKRVIVGHTYHEEPVVKKNLICLDTMHHDRGNPTAVILKRDDPTYAEFVQ